MKYPKINSLWKRNGWYLDENKKKDPNCQKGRQDFIEGDYACEEFGLIKKWQLQEKIDGTNIRCHFTSKPNTKSELFAYDVESTFHGRNEDSMIPANLIPILKSIFTLDNIKTALDKYFDPKSCNVWFFGEGYGPKIQNGGNYRSDLGFILFDVYANGVWLSRENVSFIADKLVITTPPIIGYMTEEEAVAYVKSNPLSLCSEKTQVMEGVICRTDPMLLQRNHEPLMMKLKCRDFKP